MVMLMENYKCRKLGVKKEMKSVVRCKETNISIL